MNETERALTQLRKLNGKVNSEIIKDLILGHKGSREKYEKQYNEYKGEVEILDRKKETKDDICNKLANDYRGYIVDTMTGYVYGNPITYGIDGKKNGKEIDTIKNFLEMNDYENLDSLTGERNSTCGTAGRLLYIDMNGEERMMNLEPWEFIIVKNIDDIGTQYGLRYYDIEVQVGGQWEKRTRVEWYDDVTVTFYVSDSNGDYLIDPEETAKPHLFDGVPLIEFPNNVEKQGDFEKVASLIDAYDRDVSFDQDEHEAFREAYLVFINMTMGGDENAKAIKNSRSMEVGQDGDVKYLTKDVNDTYIENHKKRLEQNIHKFSRIPDMADEKFSGDAQSGESRKWKLVGMETKAMKKERMFKSSLRQMFKLLATAWAKKGIAIDYLGITYDFTRNLPVELAGAAQTTQLLKGNVSELTRLSLLPFIDDPEDELARMKEEAPEINLDTYYGGEEPPQGDNVNE